MVRQLCCCCCCFTIDLWIECKKCKTITVEECNQSKKFGAKYINPSKFNTSKCSQRHVCPNDLIGECPVKMLSLRRRYWWMCEHAFVTFSMFLVSSQPPLHPLEQCILVRRPSAKQKQIEIYKRQNVNKSQMTN